MNTDVFLKGKKAYTAQDMHSLDASWPAKVQGLCRTFREQTEAPKHSRMGAAATLAPASPAHPGPGCEGPPEAGPGRGRVQREQSGWRHGPGPMARTAAGVQDLPGPCGARTPTAAVDQASSAERGRSSGLSLPEVLGLPLIPEFTKRGSQQHGTLPDLIVKGQNVTDPPHLPRGALVSRRSPVALSLGLSPRPHAPRRPGPTGNYQAD